MYERFKSFTVDILKIHRCIQKIKAEEMAELQLKSHHVSCLYYLYKENTLTATELAEICQEDKSYIAHSLRYLEERGYVFCDSKAKKRYNAPLALTDAGKELGFVIAGKIDSVFAPAGEGLTEGDRTALYRALEIVKSNLERICQKYEESSKDERIKI